MLNMNQNSLSLFSRILVIIKNFYRILFFFQDKVLFSELLYFHKNIL